MGLYDKLDVGGEFVSKKDPYKGDWAQDLYLMARDLHNDLVDVALALRDQHSDQEAAVGRVITELAELAWNYLDFAPTEYSDHDDEDDDEDEDAEDAEDGDEDGDDDSE